MGATSVTGTGPGDAGKVTTTDLAILANGPAIVMAGYATSTTIIAMSPTTSGVVVTFPKPLEGHSSNYVVLTTTVNGGWSYVIDMNENGDGHFTDFTILTEVDCDVMYLVAKVGIRPTI